MSKKQSLESIMTEIGNTINGALINPEILQSLVPYGYTEERIRTEGLAAFEAVKELFLKQKREYGEQYTATEQSNILWDKACATYIPMLKLSRIALKNHHGSLSSIGAEGKRKASFSGFIKETRTFYQNLLNQASLLEAVQAFGITPEKLNAGLQEIADLETANQSFLKEKGEARESTAARDEAFEALYVWCSDFRAVARIALADHPQQLEKLGIVVKR